MTMKIKKITVKLLMMAILLLAVMIIMNVSHVANWLDAPGGVLCGVTTTKSQTSMAKEGGMMMIPTQEDQESNEEEEEGTTDTFSCDELIKPSTAITAASVNRLRRRLMMDHRDCFQQHQDFFEDFFLKRTSSLKQHLILHIPKTAGTSLCQLAQETPGLTYGKGVHKNCQVEPYFCPLWCCCNDRRPLATCEDLKHEPDVIMNENYLDHLGFYNSNDEEEEDNCGAQRLVSMTLRNPVDRVISHVHHFMKIEGRIFTTKSWRIWQLNLIQSNYMTWSLVAGLQYSSRRTPTNTTTTIIVRDDDTGAGDENSTVPVYLFQPQRQHLDAAKMTMASMDFLLEFSRDTQCDANILHYMGIGKNNATLPHARFRPDSANYGKKQLRRESYELLNQLDTEVYEYAVKMMEVDCQFFAGAVEKEKRGKKNDRR